MVYVIHSERGWRDIYEILIWRERSLNRYSREAIRTSSKRIGKTIQIAVFPNIASVLPYCRPIHGRLKAAMADLWNLYTINLAGAMDFIRKRTVLRIREVRVPGIPDIGLRGTST